MIRQRKVAENNKYKETEGINSVQSSLKFRSLWVTLYIPRKTYRINVKLELLSFRFSVSTRFRFRRVFIIQYTPRQIGLLVTLLGEFSSYNIPLDK